MFPDQLLIKLPTANGSGNLITKDTPQIEQNNLLAFSWWVAHQGKILVYIDDDGGDVDAEVTAGDDDHAELKDGVHFEQLQSHPWPWLLRWQFHLSSPWRGAQYQKVAQCCQPSKNIMKCGVWKFHVDYIEPYGGLTYKLYCYLLVVLVPGGLCHYCPVIALGGSSFYGAAVDRVQVKLCGKFLGLFWKGGGLVSV